MTSTIVNLVAAGGFLIMPFLTLLNMLDWHYKPGGKSTRALYNVIAGILSSLLYSSLMFASPSKALYFKPMWLLLLVSGVFVIAYLAFFQETRSKVNRQQLKYPIAIGLILYLGIFCSLSFPAAKVLQRYQNYLLTGVATFKNKPLADAEISWSIEFAEGDKIGRMTIEDSDVSDRKGRFLLYFPKERLNFNSPGRGIGLPEISAKHKELNLQFFDTLNRHDARDYKIRFEKDENK